MSQVRVKSLIDAAADAVYAWHARPGAWQRLVPPAVRLDLLEQRGTIHDHDHYTARLHLAGLPLRCEMHLRGEQPGRQFITEMTAGPLPRWIHLHRFEPVAADRCRIVDALRFDAPAGGLGRLVAGRTLLHALRRALIWRHLRVALDLRRHAVSATAQPLRVLVSGASGLVGSALANYLETAGHEVWRLVRRERCAGKRELSWNPAANRLDPHELEGFDAVIHLGGANIAARRWSRRYKRQIVDSRVRSTDLLARTLARLDHRPRVFVCASAIGYYGHRGDEVVDETAAGGEGFLPQTCQQWEQATTPAAAAGIRTVNLRIGVVLSARGGALATMLPAIRAGLGGPVADGRQYMSFIALDDLLGVIEFALAHPRLSGPVNATSPHPVTNRDFVTALAGIVHRPAGLPLPAALVRSLLGEMGQALLLESCRVLPMALARAGFRFAFPTVEQALRWELGRPSQETARHIHVDPDWPRAQPTRIGQPT